MAKRAFDFIFSLLGLVLFSPILLLIAVAIKLDSKGPVFYRGVRFGRLGKSIRMYKFRSMVADAERQGPLATPLGDPRITRVGRFLRDYKLDELPQLINVLMGEMSFVGPRPEAPLYFDYYTKEEREAVLSVRPGMTDYGSLRFHDEGKLITGEDPIRVYIDKIKPEKVKLQLEYIRRQSLGEDLRIILQTLRTIVATRLMGRESDGL